MPVASAYVPPSTLTCTLFIVEPVSLAVPLTPTVDVVRVAPLYGEVIETVGSELLIVILIDVVAVFPALSVAFAIIV